MLWAEPAKGESMTNYHTPDEPLPAFQTLKEAQPMARTEATDADVETWVMEQLQADKRILDLLATL